MAGKCLLARPVGKRDQGAGPNPVRALARYGRKRSREKSTRDGASAPSPEPSFPAQQREKLEGIYEPDIPNATSKAAPLAKQADTYDDGEDLKSPLYPAI